MTLTNFPNDGRFSKVFGFGGLTGAGGGAAAALTLGAASGKAKCVFEVESVEFCLDMSQENSRLLQDPKPKKSSSEKTD